MPEKTVTMTVAQWEDLIDLVRFERTQAAIDGDTANTERMSSLLDALGEREGVDI